MILCNLDLITITFHLQVNLVSWTRKWLQNWITKQSYKGWDWNSLWIIFLHGFIWDKSLQSIAGLIILFWYNFLGLWPRKEENERQERNLTCSRTLNWHIKIEIWSPNTKGWWEHCKDVHKQMMDISTELHRKCRQDISLARVNLIQYIINDVFKAHSTPKDYMKSTNPGWKS